jgi:ABC-type arginine transport system permease subunit
VAPSTATIVAALIAAFLGSLLGAVFALSRFKRERAFDRQLDWYERMLRAIYDFAQRVEIAVTFQGEARSGQELLNRVWSDVQKAHLEVDRCASEAALYGSETATKIASKIATAIQKVAEETDAFDPRSPPESTADKIELIEALPSRMRSDARPLALEARRHLGLIR